MTQIKLSYQGEKLTTFQEIKAENGKVLEKIPPYFPDPDLVKAVELALLLRRPLLLKGEPGCGKTRVAKAVAYEIYGDAYADHYFEWNIKSTSKARDGLYTFDHLRRLRDVQLTSLATHGQMDPKDLPDPRNKEQYIAFGELGNAFQASRKGKPSILLIDEIDKADIDFPNDLLLELDQKRFVIEDAELPPVVAEEAPIIFITSNEEKELPPAFLRRCLFYYIEFPRKPMMEKIIRANFPKLEERLRLKALDRFYALRETMQANPNTEKKVSTSELIDWVKVINHFQLTEVAQNLEDEHLLHPQVLLKSLTDYKLHHKKQ